MQISQEVSPELSALSSFITLSEPLFERIRQVWEARESLQLDAEDLRLLERCYEGFSESGAQLPAEEKERLREVKRELSELSLTSDKTTSRTSSASASSSMMPLRSKDFLTRHSP